MYFGTNLSNYILKLKKIYVFNNIIMINILNLLTLETIKPLKFIVVNDLVEK